MALWGGKLANEPSRSQHILVVDDDPWIVDVLAEQLALEGYRVHTTIDSTQVMNLLGAQALDLVILDVCMPEPNGIELLKCIHRKHPYLPVLMLTSSDDTTTAIQAMQEGASDYIIKPHRFSQLTSRVERALERGSMLRKRAREHHMLEQRVREQTRQLHQQSRQLSQMLERVLLTYQATLHALEAALDARDQSAPGHCRRVAKLAVELGKRMGLPESELLALEQGARLHDIGKLGIPDMILMKPGPLTPEERRTMQRHPEIGCEIVTHIDFLQDALPVIRHHHEHYDGSGYPNGLQGQQIPLLARIFSVVDAFDAQAHARPYNTAPSVHRALANISAYRARWFDPQVVDAFMAMMSDREPISQGVLPFVDPATLGLQESR
jgi:putative nucleotidyltransferase with HDIG domain